MFDSISGVRLDPELLSASRKVEIDFHESVWRCIASEQGIGRRTTAFMSSQRKCVDVNKGDTKRPEYRSRLCGKELKRWDPTVPGTFASMGPFECVMFLLSKALMWKPGSKLCDGSEDLVHGCFQWHTVRQMRPVRWRSSCRLKKQVKGEDLIGELLKSLAVRDTENSAQIGRKSANE